MSNRSNAMLVATAIYQGRVAARFGGEIAREDLEQLVYDAVEAADFGSDERKADLYARLAENLMATTTFTAAWDIVEAAMDAVDEVISHG